MNRLGAVLQFEVDRARLSRMSEKGRSVATSPLGEHVAEIMHGALQDVLKNGGTLVVVVSEDKLTIVQRPYDTEQEALDDLPNDLADDSPPLPGKPEQDAGGRSPAASGFVQGGSER